MNILDDDDDPHFHIPLCFVWPWLTAAQKDRLWAQTNPRSVVPWSLREWDKLRRDEQQQLAEALFLKWIQY